jgi:uncharacterized membrane protein YraQ (UPF0718 family)
VLPTGVGLKKQGANTGATTAFLISTPESGVDSIAVTYALLDPIMTVARPVVAFVTAVVAGVLENLFGSAKNEGVEAGDVTCPVDGCCDGKNCSPDQHKRHHTFFEKIRAGFRYAFTEVWADLAGWFLLGLLLAGLITTLVPAEIITRHLGGGLRSMLAMLAVGIPLYICATASTPIAAALILKGVSPGATLVFLLAGPATNATSLTVLVRVLGRRATAIYLSTIAISTVLFGLVVDRLYLSLGIVPRALVGRAAEVVPVWGQVAGAFTLLILSIRPVVATFSANRS